MALIKLVDKETDDAELRVIFSRLKRDFGEVTDNFRLAAVSPGILKDILSRAAYLVKESGINPELFAVIRYAVACAENGTFCVRFNSKILKGMGFTDDNLKAVAEGTAGTGLSESDNELVRRCVKAVIEPTGFTAEDINVLKEYGFSEKQILDACEHGANMLKMARILNAFKVG